MTLWLDRDDLKPERKNIHLTLAKFEHFKPRIQLAIEAAGGGTLVENDGESKQRIGLRQ